ncbi:MAG: arsinothricin resistance N-acetyltransferase ArsN1 family A [Gemmatimonadales bacterium]
MTSTTGSGLESLAAEPIRIRSATTADAEAIAAIYNEGIRGRLATFETVERTTTEVAAWLEGPRPFLVATRGEGEAEELVGWVRASAYRPRDCYTGVSEFSVYVTERARGRRVGDALMAAFLPACDAAGLWKLVSRIFPENAASRALCARHGFRGVGVYEKHARLDGIWRDVVIVERLLPVG